MTYKTFLSIVAGHKKYAGWQFEDPIATPSGKGRYIYKDDDYDEKVILDKDIGPGPDEINITNMIIDNKIAVREVFERLSLGVNR